MIQFIGTAGTIFALEIYTIQAVRMWWFWLTDNE